MATPPPIRRMMPPFPAPEIQPVAWTNRRRRPPGMGFRWYHAALVIAIVVPVLALFVALREDRARSAVSFQDHAQLSAMRRPGLLTPVLPALSTGALGFVRSPRIIQIVDRSTFLGSVQVGVPAEDILARGEKHTVLVKGFDTRGHVDGDTLAFDMAVKVEGIESYTTVLGAKRTVYVLRYVDIPPLPDR